MVETGYNESERKILLNKCPVLYNYCLFFLHILLSLYVLIILPLYVLRYNIGFAVTIIPVALITNQLWSLIHDAVHRSLIPDKTINELAGRSLAITFGSPFSLLREAHLMHHKYNRTELERLELYEPDNKNRFTAAVHYYFFLLGGLFLTEFIAPILFFLPVTRLRKLAEKMFEKKTINGKIAQRLTANDKTINSIRVDHIIILFFLSGSLYCYGEFWWILAIFFAIRAFLISFLDYVYHYQSPLTQVLHAYNLLLPKSLSILILHFNYHGVHHQYPSASWISLPDLFRQDNLEFDFSYFSRSLLQLKGPISSNVLSTRLENQIPLHL